MSSNSSSGREDPHARADLKLVDDEGRPRESGSPPASPSPESASHSAGPKRRGLPVWLFLLVVLVLGFALIRQLRIAGELESQVTNLQGELTRVSVELEAHQNRLREIRSGVHDLSASLENLRVLVDTDPGQSVSAPDGSASKGADTAAEPVPAGVMSGEATDDAPGSVLGSVGSAPL